MKLMHGDCLELMKEIPDGSVDLVVMDPPYNMGKSKEWDKPGSKPAKQYEDIVDEIVERTKA